MDNSTSTDQALSPVATAALVGLVSCPVVYLLLSLVYGFTDVDLAARIATVGGSVAILGPAIAFRSGPPDPPGQARQWIEVIAAALAGAAVVLLAGVLAAKLI